MKKILCLISIFFMFLTLPVFAEYKPIPKELSKQYKAEMEQIIDEEYPKIIKNIDDDIEYGKKLYEKLMKNGYDLDSYEDLSFVYDLYIPTADLYLYDKLAKITQEKYLGIKYDPIGTDWVTPYEKYLKPYFKDNDVDTKLLKEIVDYEVKKGKIIKRYIKNVSKFIPNKD